MEAFSQIADSVSTSNNGIWFWVGVLAIIALIVWIISRIRG